MTRKPRLQVYLWYFQVYVNYGPLGPYSHISFFLKGPMGLKSCLWVDIGMSANTGLIFAFIIYKGYMKALELKLCAGLECWWFCSFNYAVKVAAELVRPPGLLLNYWFRLSETMYFWLCNCWPPGMFLPRNPLCQIGIRNKNIISYGGVPCFATNCLHGVCCLGLTTCLLYFIAHFEI